MDRVNQPSPYFIRRAARPETERVDLREFSVADEQVHPLRDYWIIVKRHRWLIVLCAIAVLSYSALYTFSRTPLYTAEATLLIERKAPQVLKVQDARADSGDSGGDYGNEFYKTQYEILKSRALAERVIRDEGLESHPLFVGGKADQAQKTGLVAGLWHDIKGRIKEWMPSFSSSQPKTALPDAVPLATRLAGSYLSMLEIRPVGGTSLVQVRFTTPDPALSARLANAHAFSYMRYGIALRAETNEEATEFLKQKLTELKERVEQSEAALNSYRRDKGILSIDDKDNLVADRLVNLNRSLTEAEADRIGLEAKVGTIRGRNPNELSGLLDSDSDTVPGLKSDLAKLEADYAALSKQQRPGYPRSELDALKARVDDARRRLQSEIQNQVKAIEASYEAAKTKEAGLRASMEEQKKATLSLKDDAVQYTILAREVDTNKQLYDGVLQRLKEIGVAAEVRSSNIYVMGKAQPPGGPSYPDKRRGVMMGLFLGLAAGIGLAFLFEQLDNTLKSPEEAERYMRLPNLGVVPDFTLLTGAGYGYVSRLVNSAKAELPSGPSRSKDERQLVLDHHPLSLVTEAYRALRSALLLSQAGGPPQTMLITSAARGEGKTTTIVNTAVVFAQMGIQVVVIDADLRRPYCHKVLRMENSAGLAEVLTGQVEWQNAVRPTAAEHLFLMSAGAIPPNPAELLGSKKMHELVQELREHYEFIFIDSSPVMAVTDAVFLSTMVDGTLLLVNRRTPKPLARKARTRLETPHTKILGILLNRVDVRSGEYGAYYRHYYEYYAQDTFQPHRHHHAISEKTNGQAHAPAGNGTTPEPAGNGEAKGQKAPRDGMAQEFLDILTAKLGETLGPMAAMVVRDHIHALGESSRAFPEAGLEELAKEVSQEIPDETARRRFEKEMAEELLKLSGEGWEQGEAKS